MRRRSGATERPATLARVPSGMSVVQTALVVLVAGAISVVLSVMAWVQAVRDAKAARRRQLLLALGLDDDVPRLVVGFLHPFWCVLIRCSDRSRAAMPVAVASACCLRRSRTTSAMTLTW